MRSRTMTTSTSRDIPFGRSRSLPTSSSSLTTSRWEWRCRYGSRLRVKDRRGSDM